jgi:hypothetical protein
MVIIGAKEHIMIELTPDQRRELASTEPRVHDSQTGQTYVLVRAEVYERLKGLLEDGDWPRDAYRAAMEVFARDGWDDPRMDVYDARPPVHKEPS